jgi:hypothetical protein
MLDFSSPAILEGFKAANYRPFNPVRICVLLDREKNPKFIDDCFTLHENIGFLMSGTAIATAVSNFLHVRPNDVGEIVCFLTEVFIFLSVVGYGYWQEKDLWNRAAVKKVAAVMLLGGFIGVGADMINQVLRNTIITHHFFGLFQSFSKMLFLSLLAAFSMDLFMRSKKISQQTLETTKALT